MLYLFWSLLKIHRFFSITGNCKQKIWLKQLKAALALDFSYFQHVSKLVTQDIYDYAVSFVAGGVVRFYFLHKRHISIPFGLISRGTEANEVFVYVHTKNIFAQRLLGAVRVFL